MRLKALVLGLLLWSAGSVSALAQGCTGNPAAGSICANVGATPTLPAWALATAVLDRNFGGPSTQGTMLNRGASVWSATATPALGKNGGTGGSLTLNGSTSGLSVIGVQAAAGSSAFNLPVGNGSANQVLITDGAGNTSWSNAGAGTVSSVALAMPGIFTVSGSPVVGAGTLTAALATQAANLVWAGPTTGAASAPTFRSLVGADLPNPSPSSLGGVQSLAAVSSQWIRQISTSGVPSASQPAFTDISGTLAAAQCPNPSASTVGCVQSFALQASKWISAISTSGVPSATQPAFTDVSGSLTLSQLPSISNNSVLGNNSGGTAIPATLSASNVLDMVGATQGQVLYRNAAGWVVLAPGTNGQVFTTGGAAANPAWTTVTGTGTVTNVATGAGLSGGPITTTGTLSLAAITAGTVLANVTGGSAVPIANTPSAILDLIGSTQGNILYRGVSNWSVLAPGTNGQVLTQGASTPSWSNAGTLTNVTISAGAGIGTSGTCTISTSGTCTIALSAARQTLPTVQTFSSGSGTYTKPANVLWIEIEAVGGGGGGSGSGTSPPAPGAGGNTCWNTSGAACTTPVYIASGGPAANATVGGAASCAAGSSTPQTLLTGGSGGDASALTNLPGQNGGGAFYGAGGIGGGAGQNGKAAAGFGGGGGGAGSGGAGNAGGGGAGACYFHTIINSPAGTYTYAVGVAGTAGSAGGAGATGGAGTSGYIQVTEHYGS